MTRPIAPVVAPSRSAPAALSAAGVVLIAIAATGNTYVFEHVLTRADSRLERLYANMLGTFLWSFTPNSRPRGTTVWVGELVAIAVAVLLTFLFVYLTVRRGSFVGTWIAGVGAVLLAVTVAVIVRSLIVYSAVFGDQRGQYGRVSYSLFLAVTGTAVMFALLTGLLAGLVAAIIAVVSRQTTAMPPYPYPAQDYPPVAYPGGGYPGPGPGPGPGPDTSPGDSTAVHPVIGQQPDAVWKPPTPADPPPPEPSAAEASALEPSVVEAQAPEPPVTETPPTGETHPPDAPSRPTT